jgi:hypothetical protein
MRERFVLLAGWVCVAGAAQPVVRADVVSLGADRDNTLYENEEGTVSNGAGAHFFAGTTANLFIRRGMVRFDVAPTLPANTVVLAVRLTLHMSRTNTASEPVSLHRALADWGEGASVGQGEEGSGTNAEPGDATWLHAFYDTDLWSTPGGDFVQDASASILVTGNGFYSWGSTPSMVADVQAWVDNPASGFGWLVMGNEEVEASAKRFDSRENPEEAFRPALVIEYSYVPGPLGAAVLMVAGGVAATRGFPRSRGRRSAPC